MKTCVILFYLITTTFSIQACLTIDDLVVVNLLVCPLFDIDSSLYDPVFNFFNIIACQVLSCVDDSSDP